MAFLTVEYCLSSSQAEELGILAFLYCLAELEIPSIPSVAPGIVSNGVRRHGLGEEMVLLRSLVGK